MSPPREIDIDASDVDIDIDESDASDASPHTLKEAFISRPNVPKSTSSSELTSKSTRFSSSSASQSPEHDENDDEYDESVTSTATTTYRVPNSYQYDNMLSRDSLLLSNNQSFNMRDSLMVSSSQSALRQSEFGSALMRMDSGYAKPQQNMRRNNSYTSLDGLTPLLQAARLGDLVMLNSLIIQPGTDILRRDPMYGQTALHFAIRGGHLAIVQALLMPELAGSIINVPDSRRNTALHLAAAKSRRMAKLLIDAGADVNFLNMRNQTPLGVHILTATRDDPTMTELLLQARANPNASVDQSTVLHVALDKGLHQIAQRLVRHGARLDMKDETGKLVFDKVSHPLLKVLLSKMLHPPVWVPDTDRLACMECQKQFSVGTRRHHCRYCGRVLCSKCTTCTMKGAEFPFRVRDNKTKKQQGPKKKQRVCTLCFESYKDCINPSSSLYDTTQSEPVKY